MTGFFSKIDLRQLFLILILVGVFAKFDALTQPWKRKDHDDWGGPNHTTIARCLRTTPLALSHGISHYVCPEGGPPGHFYGNHSPATMFAVNAWVSMWGRDAEWVYRTFFILFSTMNIGLVFLIARRLRPRNTFSDDDLFPLAAASAQAIFMFGLYFGNHFDFISEFSTFFTLLAAWFIVGGSQHRAALASLLAGLVSWAGFFAFAGLWGRRVLSRQRWGATVVWGFVAFAIGVGLMMWLKQTTDLREFLQAKVVHQGYVKPEQMDIFYPLRWIHSWIQTHSRFLSPWLLVLLLGELWRRTRAHSWNRETWADVIAVGAPGLLFMTIGHEFVYNHEFQFGYLIPLEALFVGAAFVSLARDTSSWWPHRQALAWLTAIAVLLYPFGKYKTDLYLDAFNSLAYVITTVLFVVWVWRRTLSTNRFKALLVLVLLLNISQTVNQRHEPPMDFEFCRGAREEFARTGKPVTATITWSYARDFYCAGVPLILDEKTSP